MTTIDVFAIHHRQRARRTTASPVEYASSVEIHKRKSPITSYALPVVLVLVLIAAVACGVKP